MKILHLSDTHGKHLELAQLPQADILIHSGDFTFAGGENEALDFLNWFIDLPYEHKILIVGNHDDFLYDGNIEGLPENVHYLCNSGCCINGVNFYGIPMFMQDDIDGKYNEFFQQIPENTDVLITHQPPLGFCDYSDYGSGLKHHGNKNLLERINQLHLHYHLFGHEHDSYGVEKHGDTVFSNAAVVDNSYNLVKIQKPKLFLYK